MSQTNPRIEAVDTSVRIIDALKTNDGAGITELANLLRIPKSTVFNHLKTLEENGLVVRNDDEYHLSFRFLEYGEYTRRGKGLYRVGKPIIDDLAAETGEVANILVPENGRGVYLYKAMGKKAVKHDTQPGKYIPLHSTALGKSILSRMSRDEVESIIDQRGLTQETEKTITDRQTLFEELEKIRERGYAINTGERNERVRCVGAPIQVHGVVRGAISISAPKTRMDDNDFKEQILERVKEAANVIEINLEHN